MPGSGSRTQQQVHAGLTSTTPRPVLDLAYVTHTKFGTVRERFKDDPVSWKQPGIDALAFAQKYPRRVTELILRGIFLGRRTDIEWFYQNPDGTAATFPDQWEEYLAPIPRVERRDMVRAYHQRVTGSNRNTALRAARAWSIWEGATSYLRSNPAEIATAAATKIATATRNTARLVRVS